MNASYIEFPNSPADDMFCAVCT